MEKLKFEGTLTEEEVRFMTRVSITPLMHLFSGAMCREHDMEVGWEAGVKIHNGKVSIGVPFYGENEGCTATFCKVSKNGNVQLMKFARKKGMRKAGIPFRVWYHSHVDFGVSPSSTDENTIKDLAMKSGWYYRGIVNRKRDLNLTFHFVNKDGEVEERKCTSSISPLSWEIENEAYKGLGSMFDIIDFINKKKVEYNYGKYVKEAEEKEKAYVVEEAETTSAPKRLSAVINPNSESDLKGKFKIFTKK